MKTPSAACTPSTIGTLLRQFTFGHARRLETVLREHLAERCGRVPLLRGVSWLILLRGESVGEDAWTPVRYPGAVRDPDTAA